MELGDIFMIGFCGGLIIMIPMVIWSWINSAEKYRSIRHQGIRIPREEVTLLSCRSDVDKFYNDFYGAIGKSGIGVPDYMHRNLSKADCYDTWLCEYMRFLRYLDVKLIIVKKKHLAKVNEYIKELNRKAVIILFIAITLPAVAFYVAAGFSMPYIEMAALKTRVVAQRAYNYLLSILL